MPEYWRKANVIPISKQYKKEDPGTYSPVSLISIPEKITEHLILKKISRHLTDKKVLRNSQHGFSKGKSCLTNLISFYS